MKRLFLTAFLSFTLFSFSTNSNAQQTLLHYWSFNKVPSAPPLITIPAPVIKSDYSYIDTNKAVIQYDTLPGTPQHFVDSINTNSKSAGAYDAVAGDATYAQLGFPAGNALRVRNPSWSSQLRVYIPTTFYSNPVLTYQLESSSTNSGQHWEVFSYSIDSGKTWRNHTTGLTVNGLSTDTLDVTQGGAAGPYQGTNWGLVTIGFGGDTNVNNNPKLVLRITFVGNAGTFSGNNRLENMSVMAGPVPKAITISQPTAGVTLYRGQLQTISYSTSGAITPSRTIYFSADSGVTWNQIVSTTQTSYTWTVGNANSNNCFIKIVDTNGVTGKSGRFNMRPPTITLLQPTGGGTLITGSTQLISYLTFGAVSDFRALDYSIDSGKNWNEIVISTTDTFTWTIPSANSHTCYVEVIDQHGIIGKSGIFTILTAPPPPPPPDTSHKVLVHYWNFNNLSATYKVPNVPHVDADYSVLDTSKAFLEYYLIPGTSNSFGAANGSDNLDNVASADTANLRLGAPAGQALRVRNPVDSIELRWHIPSTGYNTLVVKFVVESSSTASGDSTQVYSYSTDGGVTWQFNNITVNGSNVDTMNSTNNPLMQGANWGLVTVTFGSDVNVNNNPNLIFRIIFRGNTHLLSGNNRFDDFTVEGTQGLPPPPPPPVKDSIAVSTPVAGDTLLAGTQKTVSYSVTATTSAARSIDYSTNGGTTWTSLATGVTALSYNWKVPTTPTSNGLIRVEDSAGVIGMSGKFVIVIPGTVTSVSLSSTKVLAGGSANIMWSASGYLGNTLNIDVAYDGQTWNPIVAGIPASANGSYPWTAPLTSYTGVLVRLTFASGTTGTSAPFNIAPLAGVSDGSNTISPVEIWPNPAKGELHFTNADGASTITIFDATGATVVSQQADIQGVLDVSHLASGVYYIRVRNAVTGAVSITSFVKE